MLRKHLPNFVDPYIVVLRKSGGKEVHVQGKKVFDHVTLIKVKFVPFKNLTKTAGPHYLEVYPF